MSTSVRVMQGAMVMLCLERAMLRPVSITTGLANGFTFLAVACPIELLATKCAFWT